MIRVVTYTARRWQSGLDLDDLEKIIEQQRAIGGSFLTPTVEIVPARPGQKVGKIRRVRIEG